MATKTINGKTFHIHPVGLFAKLHLDRQLLKMVAPVIKGFGEKLDLKNIKDLLKLDLDISAIMDGVVEGLSALSEKEYETFIARLLEKTQVEIPGKGAFDFTNDPTIMEDLFAEDLISFYELLFAAMKENKLSPFALMSRGSGILGTNTSEENPANETTTGSE